MFANGRYSDFLPHRSNMNIYEEQNFLLSFDRKDGNGRPQAIIIEKIWWGIRDSSLDLIPPAKQKDVDALIKSNTEYISAQSVRERTVVIFGLPVLTDLKELAELESVFWPLFEEYGAEAVTLPPNTGLAFVKLADRESITQAINVVQKKAINFLGDPYILHSVPFCN